MKRSEFTIDRRAHRTLFDALLLVCPNSHCINVDRMVVLEELERARRRNAPIYAEVLGFGSSFDAYGVTKPDPSARGAARAIEWALKEARVDPGTIGLVWVDIQGHEGRLFRGAQETLRQGMPVISEFWPYGIRRSGLERDAYAEIVRSRFARFAIVDAATGRIETRDVAAIPEIFDAHPLPEQNLELILFPRVG